MIINAFKGQMKRPVTIHSLSSVLQNKAEHRMVRHEAAESLGAIGEILPYSYLTLS